MLKYFSIGLNIIFSVKKFCVKKLRRLLNGQKSFFYIMVIRFLVLILERFFYQNMLRGLKRYLECEIEEAEKVLTPKN